MLFPHPPNFDIAHLPLTNGGVTTFLICLALVLTQRWHGRLTSDPVSGIQKMHLQPTPRVGGIAILVGLTVSYAYAPIELKALLKATIIGALPAFVFGLAEDLTKRVGVRERLLATMASGVLAWWLTGIGIQRADVWGLDFLLAWLPFSVLFTSLAIGGVANAVNMIDGFHGLAAGVVLIGLSAIGIIAYAVSDPWLAKFCLVIAAVVFGFLLVNFPFGRIFLGDGGAYLMGYLLAWAAILLVSRNPSVSAWTAVLVCFIPIGEAFYSMGRRLARQHHPGHPDRLHLHSLIRHRVVKRLWGHRPADQQNAAVSPLVWLIALFPAAGAVIAHASTPISLLFTLSATALYIAIYQRLIRWSKRQQREAAIEQASQ